MHQVTRIHHPECLVKYYITADLFVHGGVPHEEEAEEAGRPIPSGVGAQLGGHYGHLQQQGQGLHSEPGGEVTWTPGPSLFCSSRAVDTPAHISSRLDWIAQILIEAPRPIFTST